MIDGSGMLEAATDSRPLTKVGEVFHLDMDREPLGDLPGVGKYKVMNTVTQIVPGRLFEWSVGNEQRPSYGHVYGWEIEPVGQGECIVTNYCDWSGISESRRVRTEGHWPVVPVAMMEKSVANLERLVTAGVPDHEVPSAGLRSRTDLSH